MAEVISAPQGAVPATMTATTTSKSPSPTPPTASTSLTTTNDTTTLIQSTDPSKPSDAPKRKIIRRRRRPARPQIDPSELKTQPPPQTGTIFNIWYNKWSGGDREDAYLSQTHALNRCSIATDAGYTRADSNPGSYFCLFFARGICPKGHECEYLHRLPGLHDHFNPNVDCFGRDKHSDYRDDMGGVGSFTRQNRTLYVGRIHVTSDIEEVVARHFAEWGEVERTRVLTARGVAFVTYVNEANSQFAKEAMAHQSLDHEEILNVRWATVDPNPMAAKREARMVEEQAAVAVRKALGMDVAQEVESREGERERKRKRIQGGQEAFALEGYEAPDDVWFKRREILGPEPANDSGILQLEDGQADANKGVRKLDNGILSEATLAAIDGQGGISNGTRFNVKEPTALAPSGPLVGYGSDSEDD